MATDLGGKTIRWTYADGPMKGKHFEHSFASDGTVTWKEAGEAKPAADSHAKYQFQRISGEVYVVSYLSNHGFTLTTVVDERSGAIVSFASNEKDLVVQRGSLERS
jgi:hypothetical protein